MAGVHGLQHVEGFAAAAFADHDPVGPHPQRVDHQVPDADPAGAVDARRPRLEPNFVGLPELEFSRVFDRHHPLVVGDERGEHVERGRLARAGAAGDQDIEMGLDAALQKGRGFRGEAAEVDQVLDGEGVLRELSDRQRGAVDRERRDDGIDARAVGKAAVDHRRVIVDPPADEGGDLANHADQLGVARESDVGGDQLALAFDVDLVRAIDHHLADGVVVEQGCDRAIVAPRQARLLSIGR